MSVQSQIDRIEGNIADTYNILAAKGATLPTTQNSDNLPDTADSIVPAENLDETLSDQDSLIAQIQTALQGKGAGSGSGEDVTAETEAYTDLLADLETAIDSLPEGGGSVETCTVVLQGSISSHRPYNYVCTTLDTSGNITTLCVQNNSATIATIQNVVCGSAITVTWYTISGVGNGDGNGYDVVYRTNTTEAYHITAGAGETTTIENKTSGGSSGGSG